MKERTKHLLIAARSEAVFEALTNESSMRLWLSDTAEFKSPRERMRFWGHRLHSNPSESQSEAIIQEIEAPTRLRFTWNIFGHPSTVQFDVTEVKGGAKVAVTHSAEDEHEAAVSVDRLSIWLHGLRDVVETGQISCLADHSQAGDSLSASIRITATSDQVFAALTEPELLNKWIAADAIVEPQVGGVCSYGWTMEEAGAEVPIGPTQILSVETERQITTDWQHLNRPMQVEWKIEGEGGTCKLTITHRGFGEDPFQLSEHIDGWVAYLFELRAFLEGRPLVG